MRDSISARTRADWMAGSSPAMVIWGGAALKLAAVHAVHIVDQCRNPSADGLCLRIGIVHDRIRNHDGSNDHRCRQRDPLDRDQPIFPVREIVQIAKDFAKLSFKRLHNRTSPPLSWKRRVARCSTADADVEAPPARLIFVASWKEQVLYQRKKIGKLRVNGVQNAPSNVSTN